MKRYWTVVGVVLSILGITTPTHAQASRTIPVSYARGEHQIVTVELYRGSGVTLNFRPIHETIRRAWLDNPSQVTLDFDDPRCASVGEPGNCTATVIHLRRINPLNFPNIPSTGTTTLTVLTDVELYKFQLSFPNSGSPSYYTLEIQPNPSEPQHFPATQLIQQHDVRLVAQGLRAAQARNLITERDPLWNRIQIFLQLLQDGVSEPEAVRRAGVSQSLIVRLAEMGQSVPSSAL
jgi:hypothetical protein